MMPISASEISSIQASANALLSLPCVIQRKTTTPDTMGQASETWATVSPPGLLVGMKQPGPAELQNYDYLIGGKNTWQVHFPDGTDVLAQDHLLLGGFTLVVQVVLEPHSYPAYTDALVAVIK